MKKYSLTIIAAVVACLCNIGCYYSEADEYVQDHTEHDWYDNTSDGFVVDFLMEESDDVGKSAVSSQNLLLVNRVIYEYTGSQYNTLKSITMWIPSSMKSWNTFNEISPDGSASYDDTMFVFYDNSGLDSFVLAINPDLWLHGSRTDILYFYVHELTHYISSQENSGDSDHNHLYGEYWDDGGLYDQLLDAVEEAFRK